MWLSCERLRALRRPQSHELCEECALFDLYL